MENLIESIRTALTSDATPDARIAGASACRTILAALEGTAGEPMATAVSANPSPIASIIGALRGVPPDQLLDLAITKLRAALPASAEVPAVAPIKFHILPVGGIGRRP